MDPSGTGVVRARLAVRCRVRVDGREQPVERSRHGERAPDQSPLPIHAMLRRLEEDRSMRWVPATERNPRLAGSGWVLG
jgi:hypothetical protein